MIEERTFYQASNCTIARTLQILGDKWTLLIIRESFYGATRFEQFHRVLNCPRNLLSERLNRLVEEKIFEKSQYRDSGSRTRKEYRLTDKGRELRPILLSLMQWGDRYEADPEGPPVIARHAGCGSPLQLKIECAGCHGSIELDDVELVPGPSGLPAVPG
jgi:DNA-binding HxlR family transcriptional regulator